LAASKAQRSAVAPFNPNPVVVNPGATADYNFPEVRIPSAYFDAIIRSSVTVTLYVNGDPTGIDVGIKPVPGSSALTVTSGDTSFSYTHDIWTGDAGPVAVTKAGKSVSIGGGLDGTLGPVSTRTSATLGISPSGQVMPASWTLTGDVDLNGVGDLPPTRIETTIDTKVTYEMHPERPAAVLVVAAGVVIAFAARMVQYCSTAPCY
jgi:hypothetical protein